MFAGKPPLFIDLDETLIFAEEAASGGRSARPGSRRIGPYDVLVRQDAREMLEICRAGGRQVFAELYQYSSGRGRGGKQSWQFRQAVAGVSQQPLAQPLDDLALGPRQDVESDAVDLQLLPEPRRRLVSRLRLGVQVQAKGMGGCHDSRHPRGHCRRRHVESAIHIGGAIVNGGEDVRVEVYHGPAAGPYVGRC